LLKALSRQRPEKGMDSMRWQHMAAVEVISRNQAVQAFARQPIEDGPMYGGEPLDGFVSNFTETIGLILHGLVFNYL
jgi:hypothetical protein